MSLKAKFYIIFMERIHAEGNEERKSSGDCLHIFITKIILSEFYEIKVYPSKHMSVPVHTTVLCHLPCP